MLRLQVGKNACQHKLSPWQFQHIQHQVRLYAAAKDKKEKKFNEFASPLQTATTQHATFKASQAPESVTESVLGKWDNWTYDLDNDLVRRVMKTPAKFRWFAFVTVVLGYITVLVSLGGATFSEEGKENLLKFLNACLTMPDSKEAQENQLTKTGIERAFEYVYKFAQNPAMWLMLRDSDTVDSMAHVLKSDLDPVHLKFAAKALIALIENGNSIVIVIVELENMLLQLYKNMSPLELVYILRDSKLQGNSTPIQEMKNDMALLLYTYIYKLSEKKINAIEFDGASKEGTKFVELVLEMATKQQSYVTVREQKLACYLFPFLVQQGVFVQHPELISTFKKIVSNSTSTSSSMQKAKQGLAMFDEYTKTQVIKDTTSLYTRIKTDPLVMTKLYDSGSRLLAFTGSGYIWNVIRWYAQFWFAGVRGRILLFRYANWATLKTLATAVLPMYVLIENSMWGERWLDSQKDMPHSIAFFAALGRYAFEMATLAFMVSRGYSFLHYPLVNVSTFSVFNNFVMTKQGIGYENSIRDENNPFKL